MVTRGPAPSAACPRCGEVAPASHARLVTCGSCKLGFDPSADRPISIRRNRAAALIERIGVTRTPTTLTLRSSFERRKGIAIAASGVAIIAGAWLYGFSAFGVVAATVGAATTWLGIAFAGPHVIRIDPDHLSAGRLLYWRRSRIASSDLDRIEVGCLRSGVEEEATHYVAAHPDFGGPTVLFATKSEELAEHVARLVRDAVATMPPKLLEATAEPAIASVGMPIRLPGDVGEPD